MMEGERLVAIRKTGNKKKSPMGSRAFGGDFTKPLLIYRGVSICLKF
jgi:hypothetical protein